jgi:hypothetical protein
MRWDPLGGGVSKPYMACVLRAAQVVIEGALQPETQARWSAVRPSPERVVACKLAKIPGEKIGQKVTAVLPHAGFACMRGKPCCDA